jgi:hypothetical protein
MYDLSTYYATHSAAVPGQVTTSRETVRVVRLPDDQSLISIPGYRGAVTHFRPVILVERLLQTDQDVMRLDVWATGPVQTKSGRDHKTHRESAVWHIETDADWDDVPTELYDFLAFERIMAGGWPLSARNALPIRAGSGPNGARPKYEARWFEADEEPTVGAVAAELERQDTQGALSMFLRSVPLTPEAPAWGTPEARPANHQSLARTAGRGEPEPAPMTARNIVRTDESVSPHAFHETCSIELCGREESVAEQTPVTVEEVTARLDRLERSVALTRDIQAGQISGGR